MGLSSGSSTNKPVYSSQVEGAAGTVKSVYDQQAPQIAATAGKLGGVLDTAIDRYNNGSVSSNAATDYATKILGGEGGVKYSADPYLKSVTTADTGYNPSEHFTELLGTESLYKPAEYFTNLMSGNANQNASLDDMVALTGRNIRDTISAGAGTRGLTGGTAVNDIISKNLADSEIGLRYNDYQFQTGRMDDAAKYETGRMDTADMSLGARQDSAAGIEAGRSDAAYQAQQERALQAAEAEAQRKQQAQIEAARQREAAAALAAQMAALESGQVGGILDTATVASGLPLDAASQYAGATSSILGGYQNTKTTQPWGGALVGAIGTGLGGWASGGFAK